MISYRAFALDIIERKILTKIRDLLLGQFILGPTLYEFGFILDDIVDGLFVALGNFRNRHDGHLRNMRKSLYDVSFALSRDFPQRRASCHRKHVNKQALQMSAY